MANAVARGRGFNGRLLGRSLSTAAGALNPTARNLYGYLFSLPLIVLFLAFVVYPLYFEATQAFDRYTYEVLFSDPIYVQTVVNTIVYVGIAVNTKLFLALLLSGVLQADTRGVRFLSAIFLLPWAIPVLPGILSIRWMLSSQWGIMNLIMEDLGFGSVHWLASRWMAIGALIVFHIWKYLPFWTVIFLAGRRGIPRELYEATAIDGAGGLQNFRYVTFPMLKGLYLICTLLSMVFTLGDFTNVWLLTGGAPGDSTHVLATLAYRYTFLMGKIDWGVGVFATALPVTLLFIFILIKKIK
ncbi:MAG TPA: sugar ABC transporter permease [Methylomirabilota bacterium]|jgi:multiple sugar transport system permease protein|nr:sugar ABC transporter permease [Methylomirabilota bacterium]